MLPDRSALRAQLLTAVKNADSERIASIITRLLAQLSDADAETVVASLVAGEDDSEAAAEAAVREGKEQARKQIGDRDRRADAFR